jgi:hypothetical protein
VRWFRHALIPAALVLVALTRGAAMPVSGQTPAATEPVDLVSGCTNVSLTWPAGTPVSIVAVSVSPAGSVRAIWKLDAATQHFLAWSAEAPQASDLTVVNPLDAVYVCTTAAGVMSRPVLSAASSSPAVAVPAIVPVSSFVSPVTLVAVSDTMWRGGSAYVTVSAPPGTSCDIAYAAPPGTPLSTTGLGPRKVDQTGLVTWYWTIPLNTIPGAAGVTVVCGGVTVSTMIRIT